MADLRKPALRVLLNGAPLDGVIDAEIEATAYGAADRFRLCVVFDMYSAALWDSTLLEVEIAFSDGLSWRTMLVGNVDRVALDAIRGQAEIEGRDLTAGLIEARIDETFENLSVCEIVSILAIRYGLIPAVIPTSDLAGRLFQNNYSQTNFDQFSRATTAWDLINCLAEQVQYDAWVDGRYLYFKPAVFEAAQSISITPQDCITLRLERIVALSDGVSVLVKSWNTATQQSVVGRAGGGGRHYAVVRPNLTGVAAATLAAQIWMQMAQHERVVDITLPGEVTIQPRTAIQLSGTKTVFDNIYVVSEVSRRFSIAGGFVQTICARRPPWMLF